MSADPQAHVVELELRLGAPPEEVFPYLVDPERYVQWQGVRAELDPRPGGVYRVWMDAHTVASGEYLAVDAPERVVFTWGWEGSDQVPPGSTTVELTLRADGDQTVLRLRHSGLPDEQAAFMHREGWMSFGERLRLVIRGEDPGPMPMRRTEAGSLENP
jgi:uncharacterized protein YndB with AHSA1/START domain